MQTTNFRKLSNAVVISVFCAACLFTGLTVFAQGPGNGQPTFPGPGNGQPTFPGPGNSGSNNSGDTTLLNPLAFDSFGEFFIGLIDILILFAIPIIVLMIIYAGFLYVMARGSEEQVTKASRALTYAVLGGLLILGAELILKIIQGTVSQLTPF